MQIRSKDRLLEECEKEIGQIKKQYQIIEKAEEKRKLYSTQPSCVSTIHSLLRKKF